MKDIIVPISALNHFCYCPRRCWLIFVAGEFEDNEYTVEGSLGHQKVHAGQIERHSERTQFHHIYLYSVNFGLSGYADIIEVKEGLLYPVEFKRGKRNNWKNDEVQLAAQALCLEEMMGISIPRAFVYYLSSARRRQVLLTDSLRQLTIQMIEDCRTLLKFDSPPHVHYSSRCQGCSLYPICLPREAQSLQKWLLHNQD